MLSVCQKWELELASYISFLQARRLRYGVHLPDTNEKFNMWFLLCTLRRIPLIAVTMSPDP